jgi:hypothetical protein
VIGEFIGFRKGNLFVFEYDPDRVWVQVGRQVEEGVFRINPPCVLEWDMGRCCSNGAEQFVLSVECCCSEVLVERVKVRPIPLVRPPHDFDDAS